MQWNVLFGDYRNVYVVYEHKMRLITSDLLCIMQQTTTAVVGCGRESILVVEVNFVINISNENFMIFFFS